jgi:AcrR family transcriptional regulator
MPQSMTVRPVPKPASRYHHGDLRRALLQEAARTIAQEGVEGLTLREVGKRLGVSRTALYRHFSDKSALLAAVAREGFQRFRGDLHAAWTAHEGSRRGFETMGVAYVQFAVAHPAHYRVMFGDYRHLCDKDPELRADATAAFQVLVDALISLQQARLVRRDDPRTLATFIWAVVHGIAMLAIDGQLGPHPDDQNGLAEAVHFALKRMRTGIDVDALAKA